MPKRTAETQLTREQESDGEDDEIQEVSAGAFKSAQPATVEKRVIKGLPKRRVAGAKFTPPTNGTSAEEPKAPLFGGFSGFGSTTASSTGASASVSIPTFSFSAPALKPVDPNTSTRRHRLPDSSNYFPDKITFDAPPTDLRKSKRSTYPPSSIRTLPKEGTEEFEREKKFKRHMEGLNNSLLNDLKAEISHDNSRDLSGILPVFVDAYFRYAADIVDQYGYDSPSTSTSSSMDVDSSSAKAPLLSTLKMPTPPSLSFGGKPFIPSSTGGPGGFIPTISSDSGAKSAFSFPTSTSAPTFGTSSAPKTTGFTFGSDASKTTSLFSTPSPEKEKEPTTSKLFSFTLPTSSSASTPSTSLPFSLTPSSSAPTTTPTRPALASNFGFGAAGTTKPASGFGFGAAGFGKGSGGGSLGNPVGWGFGSSPPKDEKEKGASQDSMATVETADSTANASSAESTSVDPSREASPTPTPSRGELDGPGEEDETTLHIVKCKVFKFAENTWKDQGIGFFKIKDNNVTGKKRLLCRNDATTNVMINFYLTPTFKVTVDKNVLSFSGPDGSQFAQFRLRVKTPEQAAQVKAEIVEVVDGL